MIKNIVFDMGKVLIYYESMRACRHFIENEEDQKAVCTAVFDSLAVFDCIRIKLICSLCVI